MTILAILLLTVLAAGQLWCRVGVRTRILDHFDIVETLFLRVATGFLFTTLLGVALAWLGRFGWLPIAVAVLAAYMVALPFAVRATRRPRRWRVDPVAATVVTMLVVAGGWFYFPPFDVRVEARDPGIYYLAGAQLAHTGSMDWNEPIALEMSAAERMYFFPPFGRRGAFQSNRFVGFYLEDRESARVIPQALPVLPVWVAMGRFAGGVPGGLAATGCLAVLATVAVFFMGRRSLGLWPAALGASLLGASWVQAWFARYAAAEIPAQALLAIALYGFVLYRRHRDVGFGLMAAVGFGMLLYTKAEMGLVLVPLSLVFLVDAARDRLGRRDWWAVWVPLGAIVVSNFAYARLETWPYHYDLLQQLQITPRAFVLLAAGGVATMIAAGLLLPRVGRRFVRPAASILRVDGPVGRGLRIAGAAGLAAGAAWGYFVRPRAWEAYHAETGRISGGWDAFSMLELAWAVSPAAIVLACVGYAVLLVDRRSMRRGFGVILWLGLSFTVVFLVQRQIHPLLPWAYRRWLPMVIPMLWLSAAYGAVWLGIQVARLTRASGSVRLAAAAIVVALVGWPVVGHQVPLAQEWNAVDEMPRVAQVLSEIRSVTEPGSLLLFEARALTGLFRFEAALHIDGNRRVLSLPRGGYINSDYVRNLVLRFARRGVSTYLVTTGYVDGYSGPAAEPVHEFRWPTRRLREVETAVRFGAGMPLGLPIEMDELVFRGRIYRLGTDAKLAALDGGLDVGTWDDLYVAGNQLHFAEIDDQGRSYRWTKPTAAFRLPGLSAEATWVTVVADPDTPTPIGRQTLRASLDGRPLGEFELVDGWRDYSFSIPPEWAPEAESAPFLEFVINPGFRLSEFASEDDRRIVGVKIDRIFWGRDGF